MLSYKFRDVAWVSGGQKWVVVPERQNNGTQNSDVVKQFLYGNLKI